VPRAAAEIALRLESIGHVFHPGTPGEVRALDGVDLELDRGTFTVVLGTNGSGKSSLLNAIAGSLSLSGGRVYLDGWDVTDWPEHRRARRVSRVFQNPFTGTASDLSVAENLALASGRGPAAGSGGPSTASGGRLSMMPSPSSAWGWSSGSTLPSGCSRGVSARR
jgi:putative tryptophan/tyrosine transport system ATP-binding protein